MKTNDTYQNYDFSYEEASSCLEDESKAGYNEDFILKNLLLGKTRDELALELKHKNYRTIDMFMRRRGYNWDSNKQIYIKKAEIIMDDFDPATSKSEKIISMFNKGMEPLEIAKKMGMKDHRVMADYMSSKGYVWSSEKQNYIFKKGLIQGGVDESNENTVYEKKLDSEMECTCDNSEGMYEKIKDLYPMLEMISKNKDKLAELLAINQNTIPRYAIGGITITKSICMCHTLAELVKDFSNEKNISQRDIFEVSIIEFLQKYGYENEVNSLFR